MDYYVVSNNSLTSVADAIRNKSGNNQQLSFPEEFITEINNLSQTVGYLNRTFNKLINLDAKLENC